MDVGSHQISVLELGIDFNVLGWLTFNPVRKVLGFATAVWKNYFVAFYFTWTKIWEFSVFFCMNIVEMR